MERWLLPLVLVCGLVWCAAAQASSGLAGGLSLTGEVGFVGRTFGGVGVGSLLLLSDEETPSWGLDYTLTLFHESIRLGSVSLRKYLDVNWGAVLIGLRVVGIPARWWSPGYGDMDWCAGLELGAGLALNPQLWAHLGATVLYEIPYFFYPYGASFRLTLTYIIPSIGPANDSTTP